MIRLRHASQITGTEANEIVLLNSHDGTSSYQMSAGMFRLCHAAMALYHERMRKHVSVEHDEDE